MVQVLYKYLPKEYASNIVSKGEIKITTLYECRGVENHRKAADKGEGQKKVYDYNPIKGFSKPEELSWVTRKHIKTKKVPSYNIFKNIGITETSSSPDCYLLCLSKEQSEELLPWFESDAIVRIDNPYLFIKELTECVKKHLKIKSNFLFGEIVYIPREHHYSFGDIPPALIKPNQFAKEKEMRAIWIPLQEQIKLEVLTCDEIKKYCSLVEMGDNSE